MNETRESQNRETQKRIPPGQPRLKLTAEGLRPGFRGYWAKPEQFDELRAGGYAFVKKENVTVGTDKQGNTDLASLVSRSAGSDGSRLYLMQISKKWYNENQAIKQQAITQTEKQISDPQGENIYVPDGGISINTELK